ncbi:zinc finger protein 112 isoform X3 [Gadus morhua]|uniref:zinc finger protein 112 isoform X3 n=1 Tax=Gadus morhua TaxID=8049 RepID=UPI0011B5EF03|nr:zinc finger protein 112-like isoform X3 [Gadus morhua]
MSPCGSTMEEQLSSIMDVLAKSAVSEISQLFSEGSASLRLEVTQSRKENELLRMRMKVMRSELFSLRLQTRSNASRAESGFALARANINKLRTKSLENGPKPLMDHKAVVHPPFHSPSKSEALSVTSPAEQETPGIILIKIEEDISGCRPADCDAFGDRISQSGATLESLHVDAPGSSHVSSQNTELRILSVHRQGGGQLVVEGHDTLFTASELEALNSLSAHNSVAKSLDCGAWLDCRKELAVQETPDNILIKEEVGIGGCIPPVADCNDISTQQGATSDSLHPDAPGSSHMSSHKFGPPRSRKKSYRCDECMKVYSSGFSLKIHMRIHSGEKPYRCDQCMKGFRRSYDLKSHMSIHSGEKPYRCDQCTKGFSHSCSLKIHKRIHSGEKPSVCHQCNVSYSRASSLRRHMSKQHKGKGVL